MKSETEFTFEALAVLCPNGVGYNGVDITPTSDPIPTQAELNAQVAIQKAEYATQEYARNRQAEYDAQEYARKREGEYPSIQECVHAILDDQLTALQEKRQAVKIKYPRG